MVQTKSITLWVNEVEHKICAEPDLFLISYLRDDLELFGTRMTCGVGECGVCTVLIDGKAINSCLALVAELDGVHITTIEGLAKDGVLDPLQEAFVKHDAVQCGYCTPGMILAAKGLLLEKPDPDEEEIKHALAGNFCRCTGYGSIVKAVGSCRGREATP